MSCLLLPLVSTRTFHNSNSLCQSARNSDKEPPKTYTNIAFPRLFNNKQLVRCKTTSIDETADNDGITRRSANYGPPVWSHEFLQSLTSVYTGEMYAKKAARLKEQVMKLLDKIENPLEKLELIDKLQRLGVSYHFETKIESILNLIYENSDWLGEADLHSVALRFRLFRQHGYNVPQEVFQKFKDKTGNFKEALCEDTNGLLSLYEASFHEFEGESILYEARCFAFKHLNKNLKTTRYPYLGMLVSHALELPLHWTMQRFEARWFIDSYGMHVHVNEELLNFAKLDYNMVQAIHQEELKHVSRWWEELGWNNKLPFVRDRTVESYLWIMGQCHEPHNDFGECRKLASRLIHLATSIDDIYDVYGTQEELELFTDAIERWDVNLVEQLPDYMKICFLGHFNAVNELGYKALKAEVHAIPYLKKVWADLCRCYLRESRWFHNGNVQTLEDYLNNGWITITMPMISVHCYFLIANTKTSPMTKAGLDAIENYHDIIKWPSMVGRLANDLVTSKNEMERGDTLKSVQVYMREAGVPMEDARQHVKDLIENAWKKINMARVASDCPFTKRFVDVTIGQTRVAQHVYQYGDGFGHDIQGQNKNRTNLMLFEPIPMSL